MRKICSLIGLLLLLSCSGADKIQEEKQMVNERWVVVKIGEKELSVADGEDLAGLPQL